MASIYFFCMKTKFTGFSVLSYQLLGVKSQIDHKKCFHKIKFMFIYNSCITLLIGMYIVFLLFNFAHHCFYRRRFLLMGVVHWWSFNGIIIWSCWTSFQLHRDCSCNVYHGFKSTVTCRKLTTTLSYYVQLLTYFGWTVITVRQNFKILYNSIKKINKLKQKRAETNLECV